MAMAADERRRSRLEHPGDPRRRRVTLQRIEDGQDMDGVAHGAHHHDADAVEPSVDHALGCGMAVRRESGSASISRSMSQAVMPIGEGRASIREGPTPCGKVRSGSPGAKMPTTGTPNAPAT